MKALESWILSKEYTEESLEGVGAIAGKPCQIQSITDITGGHRITFLWIDNSGNSHTSTLDVKDGADGQDGTDGLSVASAAIDENNHLILTMTDSSEVDCGEVPTVEGEKGDPGEDGFSPEITVKTETSQEYVLHVETKDDSFDTPNLRGRANSIADLIDMLITNPQDGQTLVYNAAIQRWINGNSSADIHALGDIEDVDLNNLTDGQVIKWDAANLKWVNEDATNPSQFEVMPDANDFPQAIVQFVGTSDTTFTKGYFYKSTPTIVSGDVIYVWEQADVQPSSTNYNDLTNRPEIESIELVGNKSLDDLGINGKFQFTTLPAAADNIGKIVQYIGATTADLKKGFWYASAYDTESSSYIWINCDVSSNAQLESRVSTLEDNQGDMSTLEVAGVNDLVSAINALNGKGLSTITYTEPNLVLTYQDGSTITFNVRDSILRETQIGELANVTDTTIVNGDILQYDSAILGYKPYDILTTLTNLLQSAKDYTDQEIASSITNDAISCDAKPQYDAVNDVVVYFQNGEAHTTSHTDTRFYYTTGGDSFCSSWIDGVEYTFSISDIDFDDLVDKTKDVVSTYTESMLDKSKVPDVAALDALVDIIKTDYLSLKVNTADIVDNLLSQDATKPLSANQGKVLKAAVDEKQDIMQYSTMPVADSTRENEVLQYVGASSQAYKKGSFYQCVSDGEPTPTYSWSEIAFAPDMVAMTAAEVDALWE